VATKPKRDIGELSAEQSAYLTGLLGRLQP
jgi:hypothetical protein